MPPPENLNLDGPIYIDMEQRTNPDGSKVWQVRDTYYGTFLLYENPSPDRKLALVI